MVEYILVYIYLFICLVFGRLLREEKVNEYSSANVTTFGSPSRIMQVANPERR